MYATDLISPFELSSTYATKTFKIRVTFYSHFLQCAVITIFYFYKERVFTEITLLGIDNV